ncbi:mycofactocin precursor MftA [Streptomyces sp. NPDC002928]
MNEFNSAPTNVNPDDETMLLDEAPIDADELIEEVSIDGMCGVY